MSLKLHYAEDSNVRGTPFKLRSGREYEHLANPAISTLTCRVGCRSWAEVRGRCHGTKILKYELKLCVCKLPGISLDEGSGPGLGL